MNLLFTLFKIGYDRDGYDRNGFNKLGYDKSGYNRNGFDKSGFDREGFDIEGYDCDGYNHSKSKFIEALVKYEAKDNESEAQLAECYLKGIGVRKDMAKAFSLIIDGAYNNSIKCLKLLGDCFSVGDYVSANIALSDYFYSLAEGNHPCPVNKYKAMMTTTFTGKESVYIEEEKHLSKVIYYIKHDISYYQSIADSGKENTSWMDRDQREAYSQSRGWGGRVQEKIQELEQLKDRPYFARMDSMFSGKVESYYIGEAPYYDVNNPELNILSVWSEYGKRYRAKNELEFSINGYKYQVVLRRRFDIKNSELIEFFDDYIEGSKAAEAQITDPFLLRILEEKKGEKNITNIIRSIQLNQNEIIDYNFKKSLIVQGCAGSGKTMILLHRLANMNFNLLHLDLKRIKIITPNSQFNLFIDELSKNLKINEIEKFTLNDYLLTLLMKYRYSNPEKYEREVEISGIKQKESASRITGPTEKDELRIMSNDFDMEFQEVSLIYSDLFTGKIISEANIAKNSPNVTKDYGSIISSFNEAFKKLLNEFGIKRTINRNYTCVLYSKLLFLYTCYGSVKNPDSLLCVDEGQDISFLQYKLIQMINGEKIIFNIYGDLNQQIPGYHGIGNWNQLTNLIEGKIFELNENYRNSDDIVSFYNNKLGFNNKSFGLRTKPVKIIPIGRLVTEIKLQLLLKNRTAIISNNHANLPSDIAELCSYQVVSQKKAVLLGIKQAKGLEFDSVFVFDSDLSLNERYIAYSRALSELNIVSHDDVNGNTTSY